MGVFAVSRMYGAGGTAFAQKLAQCLNYQYVDKAYLHKVLKSKKDYPFLADIIEEEEAPSFFERFEELFTNKSYYKTALMATIYDLALKDNVVFAGRAAHIVLDGIENVITIQVVAKKADRLKRIAELKKISYEEALDLINERDTEKKEFISYYFDRELFDPTIFHFVLNSSYVSLEEAIELTCAYGKRYFNETKREQAIEMLKNRLIEKRAELLLFQYDLLKEGKIEFEGANGGKKLIVKGIVGGEETKTKVINCLKRLKDVEHIEDNLKKGILSRSIF